MFKFIASALLVMGSVAFANEHTTTTEAAPAATTEAAPAAGHEAMGHDAKADKKAPAKAAKKAGKKAEKTEEKAH